MYCKVEPKDYHEVNKSNIVQQTGYWARVKHAQGVRSLTFHYTVSRDIIEPALADDNTFTGDDLVVLLQYFDSDHCMAYVPYGPKDEPDAENHGLFLEVLSEELLPYLPKNCVGIRFDLPWESQWAQESEYFDSEGNWEGPPELRNQEMRVNFKTEHWNLVKSRTDVLPSNTVFLDLKKPEDSLLAGMKSKTRYNIRLSQRKGVRVKAYGSEMLDTWFQLYKETALRNGIRVHDDGYFRSVLTAKTRDLKSSADTKLLMADYKGEFLAAMFLVLSKNRGTYLFGASSSSKRNLMPTYALQWQALIEARNAGCKEYDMFGAAPNANPSHPMHGLYRFKKGFGGKLFHRMGCWDYVADAEAYRIYKAAEINNQAYHVN
jgi:lipid II:glycine glycyltransferase (peptidoglycan interpeptide bridge formation enzyme)